MCIILWVNCYTVTLSWNIVDNICEFYEVVGVKVQLEIVAGVAIRVLNVY